MDKKNETWYEAIFTIEMSCWGSDTKDIKKEIEQWLEVSSPTKSKIIKFDKIIKNNLYGK